MRAPSRHSSPGPPPWRLLADLFVLAVAGGVFSVPLYAVLQTAGEASGRSRAIAANNIINGIFQIGGVLAIGAAVSAGVGITLALMVTGLTVLLVIPLLMRLRVTDTGPGLLEGRSPAAARTSP